MGPPNAAVVLAAHPNDETIGLGALLSHLPGSIVVHTTDGAPKRDCRHLTRARAHLQRESYARTRQAEVLRALGLAGISEDRVHCLGAVDREASFDLAALSRRVARLLDELHPRMLVTHPYEGGHPDHDGTAFIAHAAVALVRRAGGVVPATLEMTSYHAHGGRFTTSEFLPLTYDAGVLEHVLSDAERQLKEEMFACFESQRAVLADFPLAIERVRPAPMYLFARPPHDGRLHYEAMTWPMTGERWRTLARDALAELGLPDAPL